MRAWGWILLILILIIIGVVIYYLITGNFPFVGGNSGTGGLSGGIPSPPSLPD